MFHRVQSGYHGGSAGSFWGNQGADPFNPYASPTPGTAQYNASPLSTEMLVSPVGAALLPATQPAVNMQSASQVVYAHYGPEQAVHGQAATVAGGAPAPAAPGAASQSAAARPAAPTADPKPDSKRITVKPGDTLSKLAAANGTTWQKVYELNKGVIGGNPNLIRPGQVLKMP